MPNKQNNSLIVSVQSISITGSITGKVAGRWSPPAASFFRVDSFLPQIWLPMEACEVFEKAFGLLWDDARQTETGERFRELLHRKRTRPLCQLHFIIHRVRPPIGTPSCQRNLTLLSNKASEKPNAVYARTCFSSRDSCYR
jgi:hypothetical protein